MLTPDSAPIVLDFTPNSSDDVPPTAQILPNNWIEITPDTPEGESVSFSPLALFGNFSNNAGFQTRSVESFPVTERLLLQIADIEHNDVTLVIQVYVLYGTPGVDARFQINVYRDGVLIDDKTEFYVDASGNVQWFRRN